MSVASRALCLCLLLAFAGLAARAEEVIESYKSRIEILPSGALEIVEDIVIRAEGREIRRGIYRDFQTDYRMEYGRVRVGFKILDITRDGAPEPYQLERIAGGRRIRIGSADRLLEHGSHDYRIRFRTTRQIIHLAERDEIVYQAIPYGWRFPIHAAEVTFHLPAGADILDMKLSAGPQGAGEGGATVVLREPGRLVLKADHALGRGEGMTVALAFPRDLVARPTPAGKVVQYLRDNIGILLAGAGFLATLVYYALAWHRIGRDPKGGVIIARYAPPKGFSPAAMRYVGKRRWDDTAFSAAILNLAVLGMVRITERGRKKFRLDRPEAARDLPRTLSRGEHALLLTLLPAPGDQVDIDRKNYRILQKARLAHARALAQEHRGIHFRTNRGAFLLGLLLSVAFFAPAFLLTDRVTVPMVALVGLTVLVHPLFFWLLEAPTLAGRRIMDEIQGFRLYLSVAEKDRLNFHNPPERTPELFERYLPHAVALGVEQEWGEQFDDVLAAVRDPKTGETWHPAWYFGYAGSRFGGDSFRASGFSRSVGGALAAGFSAAATPPSSKSGSGFSGGFSGGMGGGGGGGGGW